MKQESIHPRAYFPVEKRRKLHVCKQKNKDVTRRKIAAMQKHLDNHPRDGVVARHVAMLEATL